MKNAGLRIRSTFAIGCSPKAHASIHKGKSRRLGLSSQPCRLQEHLPPVFRRVLRHFRELCGHVAPDCALSFTPPSSLMALTICFTFATCTLLSVIYSRYLTLLLKSAVDLPLCCACRNPRVCWSVECMGILIGPRTGHPVKTRRRAEKVGGWKSNGSWMQHGKRLVCGGSPSKVALARYLRFSPRHTPSQMATTWPVYTRTNGPRERAIPYRVLAKGSDKTKAKHGTVGGNKGLC